MTPQRFRLHNVGSMLGTFGTFGVANLQADPNCILAQLPDYGVWGVQDFPPGNYTETQRYQWAAQRQVPWLRRNRFLNTATLSTQTVSGVTAVPITVSFKGTGTITFSTAHSGSLAGTGTTDRVTSTFTPSAGNLVCSVTGTVTEAQCENASAVTPYQEIGASWDATYTASAIAAGFPVGIWQDAGTNPVNASGQTIFDVFNAAEAPFLGPNLVSNGNFSNGTAGWTISPLLTPTINGDGTCTLVGTVSGSGFVSCAYQVVTVEREASYELVYSRIKPNSSGAISLYSSGAQTNPVQAANQSATGGKSIVVVTYPGTSPTTVAINFFTLNFADVNFTFGNVTLKKLQNRTATQPTAANRPTWTLDANAKPYLLGDAVNDTMPVTFPASYSTTASVYLTTDAGTMVTDGVTLNGSYAPLVAAKQYARVIFKSGRPAYHEKLMRWLNAKAGL